MAVHECCEDAPWQKFTGLDVNHALQALCQRHDPAEVLERVKDWVAYMERQVAFGQAARRADAVMRP